MPPLTPEQLAEASARLDGLTQKLEKTVLDDICRRIAKSGAVTDSAEWQMLRLKEMGYANDVIEQAVADYTKRSAAEVQQLFHEAAQVSDIFYSEMYTQSGKPFVPVDENPYMQQLISSVVEQTQNELVNLTRSMGFAVRQPDGSTTFKSAAKAYQSALDLAQMQVATGTFDYTTAIRNSVKALTDGGLQFVDYASGHRNRADVAARRAILTGLSQMTGKVSEHNAEELETDIVEVTAHAGARPDHAEWQGRRYSLSGKSKEYPSLEEATGYGTGDGLKGWNCRHDFYPIIPGISPPAYTEEQLANIDPPPIEYNGKTLTYYECTQKQRAMETAMRKTKREIIAAKASGDDDMFTAKSIRLRRQKEEYAKFSDKAGLLTQNERTQVYGFDKSISAKAAWAVRKAAKPLDNGGGSGIMKTRYKMAADESFTLKGKEYKIRSDKEAVEKSLAFAKEKLMAGKVDFSKLENSDVIQPMLDKLEELYKKHNKHFFQIFVDDTMNDTDFAYVAPDCSLHLNVKYMNSAEATSDFLDRMKKMRYLPVGHENTEFIITHEFMHFISRDEVDLPKSKVHKLIPSTNKSNVHYPSLNSKKSKNEYVADVMAMVELGCSDNKIWKNIFDYFLPPKEVI